MNGDDVLFQDAVAVNVNVKGVDLTLDCLVNDIIPQYQMLLGMDAIFKLGGIYVNDWEIVFGKNVTTVSVGGSIECKEALKDSVEDVDFTVQFADGEWTVVGVWKKPRVLQ